MNRISILLLSIALGCRNDKGVTAFNSTPEASITSHQDGDSVLEGYEIVFRGSASDANHSYAELTATWFLGSDVLCEASVPESDGTVQCAAILSPSDSEITLEVKDSGNATGNDSISLSVTPTAAPEAQVLAPLASGIYYSDQLISFEGILSDAEDTPENLTGYWFSSLDGSLSDVAVEPNTEGEVIGYGLLSEGQHALELHAVDTTGKTGVGSIIIDVGPPNSAPLCNITAPDDRSAGPEGELVLFSAAVSDADVPASLLSVEWSSDKDGFLGNSTANSNGEVSFPFDALSVNTHVISIRVMDELAAECVADVIYTVGTPPSLSILSPLNNDLFADGAQIHFEAAVSDNEDQPTELALSWMLDGNLLSSVSADSSGLATFTDSGLSTGNHSLTVRVTDSDGLYVSETVSFSVNGVPSAPAVSILPSPAYTTSTLNAMASGSVDPEGDPVNYSFAWLQNGQATTYATATVPSSATAKHEEWTVRVTPDDGLSAGPFTEQSILIDNTAPVLSTTTIGPNPATNQSTLTCTASASDLDGDPLVIDYSWSNQSTGLPLGSGQSITLNTNNASPADVILCAVTVTDSDAAFDSDSASITIDNRVPTLSGINISPSTGVVTNSELACSATVSDPDGDSLSISYAWYNGSALLSNADTLTLTPSIASPSDSISCVMTAEDLYGASVSDSATVLVDNTNPTVSTVSLNPSSGVQNGAVLTCTASASDPDGSAVTLSYAWTINGSSAGNGSSLTLSNAVDGDVIECTASAVDADGGIGIGSASLTLDNTPPLLSSVNIDPTSPTVQSTLTCLASASDADGDTVSFGYVWLVEGQTQSEPTSTFNGPFSYGEVVSCQVTPDDGKDLGAMLSASVSIGNTPPVVSSIVLSPDPVYASDTITATAVLSDADGHAVTAIYEWHIVDGVSGVDTIIQNGSSQSLSLLSAAIRDDHVYVVVIPNDGIIDGTPLSSSILQLQNSLPTAPSMTLSPDPAEVGTDDLLCEVDIPSTEYDTDPVSYTYVWTDPSGLVVQTTSSVTQLSDSFAGSGTSEGTWSCEVIPNDGIADGASTSASVEVVDFCSAWEASIGDQVITQDGVMPTTWSAATWEGWFKIEGPSDAPCYSGGNTINMLMDSVINIGDFGVTGDANGFSLSDYSGQTLAGFATGGKTGFQLTMPSAGPGWHHYAVTFDGATGLAQIFLDGQLADSTISGISSLTTNDQLSVGGQLPCQSCGSCQSDGAWFEGAVDWVRVSDAVVYSAAFTPPAAPVVDPSTVLVWDLGSTTGTVIDQASGDQDGLINGGLNLLDCPQSDGDADGVASWEDCDDGDSNLLYVDGSSASCPGASCKSIMDQGYSSGDGDYWLMPDGVTPVEAYCEMSTDGGGWTRVFGIEIANSQPKATNGQTAISGLDAARQGNGHITAPNMNSLRNWLNYSEMWFWCAKPNIGRTVSIKTDNPNVLDYLSDRSNSNPTATNSFSVMPDDSSYLATTAQDWGAWHVTSSLHNTWSSHNVGVSDRYWNHLFFVPYNYHWLLTASRYECDDYNNGTYNGNWYVYVR